MAGALSSKIQAEIGRKAPKRHLQRVCVPSETLSRIEPIFKKVGLTRLADVTGLDKIGIPVVMAVRPNSRSLSVSQGKGIDLASAMVAGAMESLEAYHAEQVLQPVIFARYNELCQSRQIVDPEQLPRLEGNAFHGELNLPWIEGLELRSLSPILVPFDIVHLDLTIPLTFGVPFPRNSNGLASGNLFIEAVNHGLCEVIERDAVALWRARNSAGGEPIDLASAPDARIQALVSRINDVGCSIHVEEITSDVGVPVFVATLVGRRPDEDATSQPAGGAGCHPDRDIACLRAITEAAQSRLTRIAGSRDDLTLEWFVPSNNVAADGALRNSANGKALSAGPTFQGDYPQDDYFWILAQLGKVNLEQIIVVDLSIPEFGIPVVRVIVPGLEGLARAGYAVGPRARRASYVA